MRFYFSSCEEYEKFNEIFVLFIIRINLFKEQPESSSPPKLDKVRANVQDISSDASTSTSTSTSTVSKPKRKKKCGSPKSDDIVAASTYLTQCILYMIMYVYNDYVVQINNENN